MKEEKAITAFKSGLNCAQSVFTIFSDDLNFDNDLAMKISCGFGGGMGRLQETCGAVTGAFMVLGIYNSDKYSASKERTEATYSMIQKFNERFISIYGTTSCSTLLNCDLKTEEGQMYRRKHNLRETVCEKCITDSIKILEDMMNENGRKNFNFND